MSIFYLLSFSNFWTIFGFLDHLFLKYEIFERKINMGLINMGFFQFFNVGNLHVGQQLCHQGCKDIGVKVLTIRSNQIHVVLFVIRNKKKTLK
jgi:hypothetical protein